MTAQASLSSSDAPGAEPPADASSRVRLVLVTGMSGAGRTTALKTLEDNGYEAVDNLPLKLLSTLLRPGATGSEALAINIDVRTRDFTVDAFEAEIAPLAAREDLDVRILFIDCDDEVLQRRYTETRRRHPLADDRPVIDGIRHERNLIQRLRERADLVLDTTELAVGDLRRIVAGNFALDDRPALTIFVTSFSYRLGLPREADLVFDVRFLTNPHYDPLLRPLTGLDPAVGEHIANDPGFKPFSDALAAMLPPLLPRFEREGKSYLTIAVGCTGGRHRSVFVAERLAALIGEHGHRVRVRHRDLDRSPG
ncbi:MAG: RNase adapter RapZ [Proteobacteria bacterium]|nr:RNase adapter RapZ [Pseudomonadota bacterium]